MFLFLVLWTFFTFNCYQVLSWYFHENALWPTYLALEHHQSAHSFYKQNYAKLEWVFLMDTRFLLWISPDIWGSPVIQGSWTGHDRLIQPSYSGLERAPANFHRPQLLQESANLRWPFTLFLQNHRSTEWFGLKGTKDHQVPIPRLWAGTPSITPNGSELHPAWP